MHFKMQSIRFKPLNRAWTDSGGVAYDSGRLCGSSSREGERNLNADVLAYRKSAGICGRWRTGACPNNRSSYAMRYYISDCDCRSD